MAHAPTASDAPRLPIFATDRDYRFFVDGLAERRLLAQRCKGCGTLRNPPGPMCPACNAFEWEAIEMPETGSLYSFTIHRHPPLPDYPVPHPVGLVEFDNGLRFLAPLTEVSVEEVRIGMKVAIRFRDIGAMPSFNFVPTGEAA